MHVYTPGPGSLHATLNAKGWVRSLSAGPQVELSDLTLFRVTLSLTELGLQHIDEVIGLVFR